MAKESGGENDVSCMCELCIAHDYHANEKAKELEKNRERARMFRQRDRARSRDEVYSARDK